MFDTTEDMVHNSNNPDKMRKLLAEMMGMKVKDGTYFKSNGELLGLVEEWKPDEKIHQALWCATKFLADYCDILDKKYTTPIVDKFCGTETFRSLYGGAILSNCLLPQALLIQARSISLIVAKEFFDWKKEKDNG